MAEPDVLHRTELAAPGGRWLEPSGVFHLRGAVYTVTFANPAALGTFLDLYLSEADDTKAARLHLTAEGTGCPPRTCGSSSVVHIRSPRACSSRWTPTGHSHSWMTHGDAGPANVLLAHDTWHPLETALPPESFITVAQLRTVLGQWAFGDTLPPPAVRWRSVRDVGWF